MNELDTRNHEDLIQAFTLSNEFVEKKYLSELVKYDVADIPKHILDFKTQNNVRLFKINKLVFDKNENSLDKLATVFYALGNLNSSLVFIIDSNGQHTDFYIGTRTSTSNQLVSPAKEALENSFLGNFPGSDIQNLRNSEIEEVLDRVFHSKLTSNEKVISSVSGIPSLKNQDKTTFVQGIEKLIDAMKGERFSAIFIADSINYQQISKIRQGYEKLYSQLVPFQTTELSFGDNDSHTITEGITKGITHTVNESLTDTQSYTQGQSQTTTHSENTSVTTNPVLFLGAISALLYTLNPIAGIATGAASSFIGSRTKGESYSKANSTNSSNTVGQSKTTGTSDSTTTTENESESKTVGQSRSLQMRFENKSVTNLLEKIDQQLTRLRNSEDFGMWNCAAYFLSESSQTSLIAASTFKAIMRGENSSIEHSFINTWDHQNHLKLRKVGQYLKKLHHPLIKYSANIGFDLTYISPCSLLNGKELAIQFGLPRKSVSGLPVIETAEFGRNVLTYACDAPKERSLFLGNIFHMGQKEPARVELDINSLSMHTFVTGSTGSGKSNTIYKILHEAEKKKVKFLVIEPAKGEYKHVFGGRDDVRVFGTNPQFAPLLKINPFRFPKEIHVLEHIDRLIEIFNACWPMYAAMPAVLKESIERTYVESGWDLDSSLHIEEELRFPTLHDLLKVLPDVINESGYSEELKSNYVGALVTRVKSLTNGLIGRIFVDEEIDNQLLFDENCLIDLSRIGSSETKALLMGILFMRLQEYRMAEKAGRDQQLKHLTVLEEAHHLLRKTSSLQSTEGANLQGKSVEMITNAIAEMRTYGEGFIIADQSPNLLDPSVIRNTNTKIILRLPDGTDRHEVGSAASLNEDQIKEIPKLKTGVAIVFQNNWLQPVLCAVEKFEAESPFKYEYNEKQFLQQKKRNMSILMKILLAGRVTDEPKIDSLVKEADGIKTWLLDYPLNPNLKQQLLLQLSLFEAGQRLKYWDQASFDELSKVVSNLLNGEKFLKYAKESLSFDQYNQRYLRALRKYVELENLELEHSLMQCLLYQHSIEKQGFRDFYFNWVEDCRKREVRI